MRTQDEFVLQEYETGLKEYMTVKGYSTEANEEYASILNASYLKTANERTLDELFCQLQLITINVFRSLPGLVDLEDQSTTEVSDCINYLNTRYLDLINQRILLRRVTVTEVIISSLNDLRMLSSHVDMDPIQQHKEDLIDDKDPIASYFNTDDSESINRTR